MQGIDLPSCLVSSSSSVHGKRKRPAEGNEVQFPSFKLMRTDRRRHLTATQKLEVLCDIKFVLGYSGQPKHLVHPSGNLLTACANEANCHIDTVEKVWKDYIASLRDGTEFSLDEKKRPGRPRKDDAETKQSIRDTNNATRQRLTYRRLSWEIQHRLYKYIPLSSLFRYMKKMGYRDHIRRVRPLLRLPNIKKRLEYVLNEIVQVSPGNFEFRDQRNRVVIDEKWFYFLRRGEKVRSLPDDPVFPREPCANKQNIEKAMFLSCLAHPQLKQDGRLFDGLLACMAFTKKEPAKRTSKNRLRGTLVTKNVTVNATTYKDIVIREGGLLDIIREKMSGIDYDEIVLQMDNATAHVAKGVIPAIEAAAVERGLRLRIKCQPPQSPELNINDLEFLASLQSQAIELKARCRNTDELVENVQLAFKNYTAEKLERGWAMQYVAYREVLKQNGNNDYRTPFPHTGIRKRQQKDRATTEDRKVDRELVERAREAYARM